jgi:hypothetical protein
MADAVPIEIPTTFRSTIAVHLPDGYTHGAPPLVRSRAGIYPAADYEPFAQSRKAAVAAMEPR